MKPILYISFLLIILLGFPSCSTFKLRHSQRLNDRSETRLMTTDSLRIQWQGGRRLLRISAQDQQVWIWPLGEFRFSPDSGFIGSASALQIQTALQSVQQTHDSLLIHTSRTQALDSAETINLRIHNRQSETRRTHILPARWWLYASGLVALVVFIFWLRRKIC